jgi:hypothetical protein
MSGDAAGVAVLGAMGMIWLTVIAVGITLSVLWIIALIDCLRREFDGENEKLIWILVITLTWLVGSGFIGAIIYWFVGRPKGRLMA